MPIFRACGPALLLPVSNAFSQCSDIVFYLYPIELDRAPRGTGSMLSRLPLLLAADDGGRVTVRLDRGLDPISVDLSSLSSSVDSRSWSSPAATNSLYS